MRIGRLLAASISVLAVGVVATGCRRHQRSEGSARPRPSAAIAPHAPSDEIRPAYPTKGVAPNALAARLCDVLHGVPSRRRGECSGAAPGAQATSECVRTLSYAIDSGAVTIAAADVDACAAAMAAAVARCDAAPAGRLPLPAACDGIIVGALREGAACRSSLDCEGELHCSGAGPTDLGICAPPRAHGSCGESVDTLAALTRQESTEAKHPECAGVCSRRRCSESAAQSAQAAQPPPILARSQDSRTARAQGSRERGH